MILRVLIAPMMFFVTLPLVAQKLKKAERDVVTRLHHHVSYLADDRLEGRRAGSAGEKLARQYIAAQFERIGLKPLGDDGGFFQEFQVPDGRKVVDSLVINDHLIEKSAYYLLPGSPEAHLSALPSIGLKESGVPWFYNLRDELHADTTGTEVMNFVLTRTKLAASKRATAIFLYDNGDQLDLHRKVLQRVRTPLPVPVIYLQPAVAEKFLADESAMLELSLAITIIPQYRAAHNVLGFLNNGAAQTIFIGAHYDHLGYGEQGSLAPAGRQIHNGADDNASGVAVLIELARLLKASRLSNNNYVFSAFSAEEMGLLGSKYLADNLPAHLPPANYMINLDMVGRLNRQTKAITIGGYGTSASWANILQAARSRRGLSMKYDSSGVGPSDHTSFYNKNIPVLFFFTGAHEDYHRPGDDANKLNYEGAYFVLEYVYRVIESANDKGRLAFTKTAATHTGTAATFSVGLGIMPDYDFTGAGVMIDAISEGRAAQKAGLRKGDIVVQLGDDPIASLEHYMQALSKFSKGDKTIVKVKRADEIIQADIIF